MNARQFKWIIKFLLLCLFSIHRPAHAYDAILKIGDQRFQVDTAVSAEERAKGLMYRTEMADNYGMLFIYPQPNQVSFWMKNTYLPLDILFFDSEGKLTTFYRNVPPCNSPPCPIYSSKGAISYVLEIKGGSVDKLDIKPGTSFEIIDP